jgi:hypothetical protein
MPGNFFTADCSYIIQLAPPMEFRQQLEQVTEVATTSSMFSFALYPAVGVFIGHGRYSMEHWIGSHPMLRPCDLSPQYTISYWQQPPTLLQRLVSWMMSDSPIPKDRVFTWKRAPRFSVDNTGFQSSTLINRLLVLANTELRRTEFYLLPGILYRHYHLYRQWPSDDSWYWTWYPDGEYWRTHKESLIVRFGLNTSE